MRYDVRKSAPLYIDAPDDRTDSKQDAHPPRYVADIKVDPDLAIFEKANQDSKLGDKQCAAAHRAKQRAFLYDVLASLRPIRKQVRVASSVLHSCSPTRA